jgi:hypothetical protein
MAISGDYSSPVTVNGFSCRNCSDVDRAKRNIDPANPAGGPFGINDHAKGSRAAPIKNHFSAEARQQDLMEALHKARSTAVPSAFSAGSPAAAAYGNAGGNGPGSGAGQFVVLSA